MTIAHCKLLLTTWIVCVSLASHVAFAQDSAQQIPKGTVREAVFKGDGVGRSVAQVIDALELPQSESAISVSRITAEEIQAGELRHIDVLVLPGGSGSKQGKALGEQGRAQVTQFVESGGGYLGICAGSYLATNDYSWSLNLIDAKVVDRKHWARGTGKVTLALSPAATNFFELPADSIEIHYGQGPLLSRREWDDPKVPDYQSLAIYESEIATKGAPSGIMAGTSAIVRANYGRGRVFCFSPHPELTDGREKMLADAITWLSARSE